jgi:hypothetical protein
METQQRSLRIFWSTIKSEATRKTYTFALDKFISYYKLKDYDAVTTIQLEQLQEMVEEYVIRLKNTSPPNSVAVYYFLIKVFLEINDIDLKWKKIQLMLPQKIKASGKHLGAPMR